MLGGDCVMDGGGDGGVCRDSFRQMLEEEYSMHAFLSMMRTPTAAILDGLTRNPTPPPPLSPQPPPLPTPTQHTQPT